MNKKDIKEIWKHIETINGELGEVQVDVAVIKNDIKWIKLLTPVNTIILLGLVVLKIWFGV